MLATIGGAIGSAARFLVNVGALRLLGPSFPWSTLFVNIIGCTAMGIIAEVLLVRYGSSPALRAFLMTGILGGFTTFSAFALDFAALLERGHTVSAALYIAGSVGLSIAGVFLGLTFARYWLHLA